MNTFEVMKMTFLIALIVLLNLTLVAQSISGRILDEYFNPVMSANILNKNTDSHTHTNIHGEFAMDKNSIGDTLVISFVGFKTQEVELKNLEEKVIVFLKEKVLILDENIIVSNKDALSIISDIDIQMNPINSSQDILRKVPGLFIGQHAGGGKAEQIFLRGFDIDHGTDINITVDGIPVNMVSHAHGQGYADLHFLIPETVEKVDFGKGAYAANQGNFATAGHVDFKTKDRLDNSLVKLEAGQFNTYRLLGMFNLIKTPKHNAFVASEYMSTDGYFESPQNFHRTNLFGKYTGKLSEKDQIELTASTFESKWDASGQIPMRSVSNGTITRFGAIDDTEGGQTARTNLIVKHTKDLTDKSTLKSTLYHSAYDFELYSNFTFFLEDSTNGDQIRQKENRTINGLTSEYCQSFSKGNLNGLWKAGLNFRNDQSKNNELSHTLNRQQTLEQIQFGSINETNIGTYLTTDLTIGKWTLSPSLRFDYFDFEYNHHLDSNYQTQSQTNSIVSPKFNIQYHANDKLQLYVKSGKGFHSNDTRGVVAQNGLEILPASLGFDAGYLWKPSSKMLLNMAYWMLYLEQEFVYVGDAGIVEPSGQTSRRGFDLSYRYQPIHWLFWNLDVTYTHARSIDDPQGKNLIPLAPNLTLASGLKLKSEAGFYGGIEFRHLGNRPANEDNSIVAEGFTIIDASTGYEWKSLNLGIQIQNIFNTEWNETQFATESKLRNETQSVEEIHFTPGTPFFAKALLQYNF